MVLGHTTLVLLTWKMSSLSVCSDRFNRRRPIACGGILSTAVVNVNLSSHVQTIWLTLSKAKHLTIFHRVIWIIRTTIPGRTGKRGSNGRSKGEMMFFINEWWFSIIVRVLNLGIGISSGGKLLLNIIPRAITKGRNILEICTGIQGVSCVSFRFLHGFLVNHSLILRNVIRTDGALLWGI